MSQKNEETEFAKMNQKKRKKEAQEEETDVEDTAAGVKYIMIWVVTIVLTLGIAWILDLDGGFAKLIFFAIAYAIWTILHKIFD